MNTKYFLIFWICIFFIVIGFHYWLDQKFPKQETPEPPAEMNKGMSIPVDGDSLVISFEPISNDSMKFFYSIDSTGVIDSIFVNLCYYRIFCSDSTVSFKIIYE